MMIDVDNLHLIEAIAENSKNIEGLDSKKLRKMMIENLFESHKFVMADVERQQVKGFMFATVENFDGEDVAFIQACHSTQDGSVQTMLDKLMKWGQTIGLKKAVFLTKRSPEAWQRKYKFKKTYSVMEREI